LQFAELRARFEEQMAEHLAAVGRRLREARERNRPDLTSHEKAAHELSKAGVIVTGKQYGRWERGESEARSDKREAIASMLGTSVESLWGEPPIAPEVGRHQVPGDRTLERRKPASGWPSSGAGFNAAYVFDCRRERRFLECPGARTYQPQSVTTTRPVGSSRAVQALRFSS
jgi:hypothetical protein